MDDIPLPERIKDTNVPVEWLAVLGAAEGSMWRDVWSAVSSAFKNIIIINEERLKQKAAEAAEAKREAAEIKSRVERLKEESQSVSAHKLPEASSCITAPLCSASDLASASCYPEKAKTPAVVAVAAFREFALSVMRMRSNPGSGAPVGVDENFERYVRSFMEACCDHGNETYIKKYVLANLDSVLGCTLRPHQSLEGNCVNAALSHGDLKVVLVTVKTKNGVGVIQGSAYYHKYVNELHRADNRKWDAVLRGGFQMPCLIIVIEAYTLQIWAGHVGKGTMCEPLATISLIDDPDTVADACSVLWAARQCCISLRNTYNTLFPQDSTLGCDAVKLPQDFKTTGRLRWMRPIPPSDAASDGDAEGVAVKLRSFPNLCGLDSPSASNLEDDAEASAATANSTGVVTRDPARVGDGEKEETSSTLGGSNDSNYRPDDDRSCCILGVTEEQAGKKRKNPEQNASLKKQALPSKSVAVSGFAGVSDMQKIMRRYGSQVYEATHESYGACIVKFFVATDPVHLETYWRKAAAQRIVPKLYAFARLSPVWCVAVMECLNGYYTMHEVFDETERDEWVAATREALGRLHNLGIVHGDARPCNVMIPCDPATVAHVDLVRLIDLDWCCSATSGRRYTSQLNTVSVARPRGAEPGAIMTPALDLAQVELFDW